MVQRLPRRSEEIGWFVFQAAYDAIIYGFVENFERGSRRGKYANQLTQGVVGIH
jgi:hypothetical protein